MLFSAYFFAPRRLPRGASASLDPLPTTLLAQKNTIKIKTKTLSNKWMENFLVKCKSKTNV
jgi:hypothetical protein